MPGRPSPFLFALALGLGGCIFETDNRPDIQPSGFDLSLLRAAKNPLAKWFAFPEAKSLAGLQFAFHTMNYSQETEASIDAFQRETGAYPALAGAYFDLSSQPAHLQAFLEAAHAKGCVPYVTLDPKDWDEPDWAYQKTFIARINAGQFDSALSALANTLREFSHPVLLRFGHEMNGEWYPYAGGGDADGDGKPDGPGKYVRAWRHTHDLFAGAGADNLLWIFCPNAEDFPPREWNRPFRYYPGPGYVDAIFVDAYEHYDKGALSLESSLAYFYNEMGLFLEGRRAAGDSLLKPFGLGEFGTNRTSSPAKAEWYGVSLRYLEDDARVKFHILYNGQNGAEDFSVTGLGARIRAAYAQARFQFRLFVPSAP